MILFSYSWKIVCNTMLYMIFPYGRKPVLIQWISISFEAILLLENIIILLNDIQERGCGIETIGNVLFFKEVMGKHPPKKS